MTNYSVSKNTVITERQQLFEEFNVCQTDLPEYEQT